MIRHPPTSTLFPYTTLFRSNGLRYLRGRYDHLSETDLDPVTGSCGFRFDSQRVAAWKDQEPSLGAGMLDRDRKSTRLNSSHVSISYAVFCLKKKNNP